MPISELYICSRRMRVEVTGRRAPAPSHSAGQLDMDVTLPVQSVNQSAASSVSKPYVTSSSSWTSVPGSPGGGDTRFLDCLDSPLAAKFRLTPGHCRLPSTDSGIQADAGWDSLKRGAHCGTSDVAGGARTPSAGLAESFAERSSGSDDLIVRAASSISYRETTHPAYDSKLQTPSPLASSLARDNNMSAAAVNGSRPLLKTPGLPTPSHVPKLAQQKGAKQERNPAPLNLLSSSTPVIPSPSAPGGAAGPQAGQWVMGGRNLFPPEARSYLEQSQAEMTQAAGRGAMFRLDKDVRAVTSPLLCQTFRQQSAHVVLHPVHVQHLQPPASAPQLSRPRVHPVVTRLLGSPVHPVHKLHVEVVGIPGSEACVAREGLVLPESSPNSPPAKSLAGGVPRSRVSPSQARRSVRGRSPRLPPASPGVVHNIPIKHLDTCSACLKPSSSAEPVKPAVANGFAQDSRSVPRADTVGDTTQQVGSVRGLGSGGGGKKTDLDSAIIKLLQPAAGEGGGVEGGLKSPSCSTLDSQQDVPWSERRCRIDTALSWLRNELEALRAMDIALVTQFQRCQDTIETLKQQRDAVWDGEGSEWGSAYEGGADGSELDDEEVWEDWEIAEFERKWAEDPSAGELDNASPSSSSATSTLSCATEIHQGKATASDNIIARDDKILSSIDNASSCPGQLLPAVQQDVEATV